NSTMSTDTVAVPLAREPLSATSGSTYFGTVAPSSGVCGVTTDGSALVATCTGASRSRQPSGARPASPTQAIRVRSGGLLHMRIARLLMNGKGSCQGEQCHYVELEDYESEVR